MARISYDFVYQTGNPYFGKIIVTTAVSATSVFAAQAWAAFKITAPDGTVVKDIDALFGASTPTVAPTAWDLINVYTAPQLWPGINIPTDSSGAYMKGTYTFTTYLKYLSGVNGNITMSIETITYNFCPVTNTASPNAAKLVRTLNCAGGKLKLDDLTSYTGFTITNHLLTITPPAITGLSPITSAAYSLQTNLTYTNVSYAYSLYAEGVKVTPATATVPYDAIYQVVEHASWAVTTSVFVACATLCSVASCAKKALSELEAKRYATGKLSTQDKFTHDKIVDRLVLIQTDMICGGTNIDQYLSELQTIISGVCNCTISTTATPFINSLAV